MAAALASGGVLVVADIVRPPDARGLAAAAQQLDEAVRARALALDGDLRAFAEFQRLGWNYFRDPDGDPIDEPSSLADQLAWLAEAGFVRVDAHWLLAGHAIGRAFPRRAPRVLAHDRMGDVVQFAESRRQDELPARGSKLG